MSAPAAAPPPAVVKTMNTLTKTFLDLVAIDEVYPNEDKVLAYIKGRLETAKVPFTQDKMGNIVATIKGKGSDTVGVAGHVDIAAPLQGREVIVEGDIIKTDERGLLGGDDKTAVATMLELADSLQTKQPAKTVELIFTVGEEAGLLGAKGLDLKQLTTKKVLVFDWLSSVNHIVTQSPAQYTVDVVYTGKDAHPAQWQQGKNAGAGLMKVASQLRQGDFAEEVIFNIGIVQIGNARNKVPGHAELKAEIRSFDADKAKNAAQKIEAIFTDGAKEHGLVGDVKVQLESDVYTLNREGELLSEVLEVYADMNLEVVYDSTYGCFDGNIFDAKGLEAVMMGAGYYNPHSPEEYVKISELNDVLVFLQHFVQK